MLILGKNFLSLFSKDSFGNAGNGPFLFELLAKFSAVIGAVRDDFAQELAGPSSSVGNGDPFQNPGGEFDFSDIGGFDNIGYGDAVSIDDDLPFGSFALLSVADSRAPFLAGAKLASKIPVESLSLPLCPNCPRRTLNILDQTPLRCQATRRCRQVSPSP